MAAVRWSWKPLSPTGRTAEKQIYFDDGVCGIEAGVGFEHEDKLVYALPGSVRVGAMCCFKLQAWYYETAIGRFAMLVAGSTQIGGDSFPLEPISSALSAGRDLGRKQN